MGLGKFFSEFSALSSSLQVLVIAFALFGILFGAIFVIDGWRSPIQSESASATPNLLLVSPKFLGLAYVIGAGVLPVLTDLVRAIGFGNDAQPGLAIAIYSLFVAISAIIGIIFLSLYSFLVAYSKIRAIAPDQPFLQKSFQALPFVSIALQRGNEAFLERLHYMSILEELAKEFKDQRDDSIDFLTGVFDRLVKNNTRHIQGVDAFIEFVRKYLEIFVQEFFEYDVNSGHYRGSLYFLTSDSFPSPSSLQFICGYSHWSCTHSRQPLELEKSFAGYALKNPGQIHVYVNGSDESQRLPFEARNNHVRYNTVIASAVQPLRPSSSTRVVHFIAGQRKKRGRLALPASV
jgi:hypothetical protein